LDRGDELHVTLGGVDDVLSAAIVGVAEEGVGLESSSIESIDRRDGGLGVGFMGAVEGGKGGDSEGVVVGASLGELNLIALPLSSNAIHAPIGRRPGRGPAWRARSTALYSGFSPDATNTNPR